MDELDRGGTTMPIIYHSSTCSDIEMLSTSFHSLFFKLAEKIIGGIIYRSIEQPIISIHYDEIISSSRSSAYKASFH